MTVELPKLVEEELKQLALKQGRSVDAVVQDAIALYVEASTVTDTTPADVAATQEALLGELKDVPDWATR